MNAPDQGGQDGLAIIPRPTSLHRRDGEFVLAEDTTLSYPDEAASVARLWRELLAPATGLEFPRASDDAGVQFVLDSGSAPAGEAYRLTVTRERILIIASANAGLRNAVQTVRQLLPPGNYKRGPVRGQRWKLPCVQIEDSPRFAWRGALLDVARRFMPTDFLFRLVDLLALHKLNVLHLHLTDDQGWRFPSETYPRLVEVGAWRRETIVGHQCDDTMKPRFDGTPHGGYYTRQELADLVAYAAHRNVTVVPEIDMPGHMQAAVAAYPELGNDPDGVRVRTEWGISTHVLNISEHTMQFCRDILNEVADVFPSPYIHVGGDECPRTEWHQNTLVQQRIAALGLAGTDAVQPWFTRQVSEILRATERAPVGWDEIMDGGAPQSAVVMSWRGVGGGIRAAREGHDVVMCPGQPCYFDHYQSPDPDEPLAIHGLNPIEDVYAFDPMPPDLPDPFASRVLGTQLLLWTCYTPTAGDVEYIAFPRGCALAEAAWSTGPREFEDFKARLAVHLGRLDVLSVNYRPLSGPLPWQKGGSGPNRRYDPVYS